jgi:glycerate-2-kinase
MEKRWIKNFNELATTPNRKSALEIAEAGLNAIATEGVILNSIKLENNILSIKGESFDLTKFKRIKVVGFGKASCEAAQVLETVLGNKIKEGVVIGLHKATCNIIETFAGTHPRPTKVNVEPGKKIYEMADESNEDDLIIAIVSGGGSALLCYPESECTQGRQLYDVFLKCGKTITDMNTVRKHISMIKGGGLAKIAYPATVIGLIFSDVPGDRFQDVASGPTYKDDTTVADAQAIIDCNDLGKFELVETPKEDKYFEKVHNFVLVSNKTAVEAMDKKAKELGFETDIVSTELYDEVEHAIHKILNEEKDNTVVLAAGEPQLVVTKKGGSGGRNLYMSLEEIKLKIIDSKSVFIALASDGMDNSDAAGAIVDKNTLENVEKTGINIDDSLESFDVYPIFKASGDMIITGPTGANVSDLMILLTKKPSSA